MTTLVVSDIHGNWPALRAVLEHTEGEYDELVSCGDMLGAIPFNGRVLEEIRERADHAVLGNHDCRQLPEYIWEPRHQAAFIEQELTEEQLEPEQLLWLSELPDRIQTPWMTIAHSRPFNFRAEGFPPSGFAEGDSGMPKGEFTRIGPHLDGRCCFIGHTHQQASLNCDRFEGQSGLVVNPGSVGQPWDGEAQYALVDVVENEVELRSIRYDIGDTMRAFDEYDIDPEQSEKPSHRGDGSMRFRP